MFLVTIERITLYAFYALKPTQPSQTKMALLQYTQKEGRIAFGITAAALKQG